jgi:hypothetical protein
MLHSNLILIRQNVEDRLFLADSISELSNCQSRYGCLGPLSCKRAKKHDSLVVEVVLLVNLLVLVSLFIADNTFSISSLVTILL